MTRPAQRRCQSSYAACPRAPPARRTWLVIDYGAWRAAARQSCGGSTRPLTDWARRSASPTLYCQCRICRVHADLDRRPPGSRRERHRHRFHDAVLSPNGTPARAAVADVELGGHELVCVRGRVRDGLEPRHDSDRLWWVRTPIPKAVMAAPGRSAVPLEDRDCGPRGTDQAGSSQRRACRKRGPAIHPGFDGPPDEGVAAPAAGAGPVQPDRVQRRGLERLHRRQSERSAPGRTRLVREEGCHDDREVVGGQ